MLPSQVSVSETPDWSTACLKSPSPSYSFAAAGVLLFAYLAIRAQRAIVKIIAGPSDFNEPLVKGS